MIKVKSESDKRFIIKATVNNKEAYFLLDTGASVGMINKKRRKEFDLKAGRYYTGTIIGLGGQIDNIYHCDTMINIQNVKVPQFLLADISNIVDSIEKQTNIEILGIISLSQMKLCKFKLDMYNMEVNID